ncbi:unnamed protein product [Sympodiomycopsis kandeliae]
MSATHLAIVHKEASQPGVVESRPTPQPGKGQVQIEITAAAINPVDWKIRDGIFPAKFPADTGSDAAGVVSAVGSEGESEFKVGDRVFFQGILFKPESTTFQHKAILDEKLVSKTPDNITDGEASGIQLASMAAAIGLYHKTGGVEITPKPWEANGDKAGEGKAILIWGGSSSVGQYAVQLARLSGFTKILSTSSSSHAERVKSLGATDVLPRDASTEDFIKATNGLPLFAAYDAISNQETETKSLEILKAANQKTGNTPSHYVGVWPMSKQEDFENPKITKREILGLGSNPELFDVSLPFIKAISGKEGWIGKGLYRPNAMQKVEGGLKSVDKAFDLNKKGLSGVKVWVNPQE